MPDVATKSDFARRKGVDPAAVSMWIKRGHLTAPALRPDGKIDVVRAEEQLAARIQPGVSSAARMRKRPGRPTTNPAALAAAAGDLVPGPAQQAQLQLLKAKALSASVDAERARRELMEERGRYMPTAQVEAAWSKTLAAFLTHVETGLFDLAQELGLDHAKTLALRRWWRNQRATAAEANRQAAIAMPEFIEDNAA